MKVFEHFKLSLIMIVNESVKVIGKSTYIVEITKKEKNSWKNNLQLISRKLISSMKMHRIHVNHINFIDNIEIISYHDDVTIYLK